jgi:hypothetical protein
MVINPSAQDVLLEIMRRELQNPQLSLAQAMQMPLARMLLETLAKTAGSAQSTKLQEVETQDRSQPLSSFSASPVVVRAAIEDTFDMTELAPTEAERAALLAASDIVTIDTKRRLRLGEAARAEILDAVVGSEHYETILRRAVVTDMEQHDAIGGDAIRLPSAWLRCFLSGEFAELDTAPPRELKAALAARERLRLVRRLGANIPTLADLGRRVGLAELLEPLRLLTGEQGGWDGTPRRDGFVGRNDEMAQLRAFVDELRSRSAVELVVRGAARAKRALTGSESPGLMLVEGRGGLGKSTLLAKFVLDHALEQSRPFPFAYLDFDRAGIDPARPSQLLIEIARQVGLQFPAAQPEFEALRESIRAELVRPSTAAAAVGTSEIKDPFSRFAEILREHSFGRRIFLLVLDTLEVVQWDSSTMYKLAGLVDEFRRKGLDQLRVVASGRADVPELRRVWGLDVPTRHIRLKPLLVKEAREMAQALGNDAIGRNWSSAWSNAIGGTSEQDDTRREPLAVRVAVDLVVHADPSERQRIVDDIARSGFDADQGFVASLYERRIVNHVRDRNARKLAWPGLVVRRITREIARELLAGFCEIAPEDADKAFTALGQEIWMVTKEGDALRHRPDLRARTLPLMRSKDEKKFNAIARAAVEYFERYRHRSRDDYVEWIYHRLLVSEPPEQVQRDTTPEVMSLLAKAEADFPQSSPAASYLAAQTARSRLSPRRIRALRPDDALYHLSVTSSGSFSLDDVSLDPAVLQVAQGLAGEPAVRAELTPWARALWIKTGAWRALPRTPRSDDQLPGEVLRSHMYWSARLFPALDVGEREMFAEKYLNSFMNVEPEPARVGFRTTVHAMALARIARPNAFSALDAQVARMLQKMGPNPLPSTQSALRTAIVLGELSRVPAAHLWLASRHRGSTERVRNPTVSLAELRGLVRIQPSASELRQAINDEPDAPTRFADDNIVAASGGVIEEILWEGSDQNEHLRALSRVFAARDEDWIVPVGYAAARAYDASLSAALSKRLAGYQAPSRPGEIPNDMVGAMRLADEAGDLMEFSKLVLAECDPTAATTNELKFLLNCLAAWRRHLEAVVGTDDQTPVEDTPLAPSERPPEPAAVLHPDDPQKGRWGGLDTRDGRTARAILESVERDVFYFSVTVESTDGSILEPPVIFHLHNSYRRSVVKIRRIIDHRIARLGEWTATGVFAIGVQVKDATGDWISLELDLARLPSVPKRFLDR